MVGGHDPVDVSNLVYRANLLADMTRSAEWQGGMRQVAGNQVKSIRLATIKLDPIYAKIKGYYPERATREQIVRGVESLGRLREGSSASSLDRSAGETRSKYLLVENGRSSRGV